MEKRFYELVKGEFCYAIGTNKEKLLSLAKERQMNVVEITEREYNWRSINLRVEQIYE